MPDEPTGSPDEGPPSYPGSPHRRPSPAIATGGAGSARHRRASHRQPIPVRAPPIPPPIRRHPPPPSYPAAPSYPGSRASRQLSGRGLRTAPGPDAVLQRSRRDARRPLRPLGCAPGRVPHRLRHLHSGLHHSGARVPPHACADRALQHQNERRHDATVLLPALPPRHRRGLSGLRDHPLRRPAGTDGRDDGRRHPGRAGRDVRGHRLRARLLARPGRTDLSSSRRGNPPSRSSSGCSTCSFRSGTRSDRPCTTRSCRRWCCGCAMLREAG